MSKEAIEHITDKDERLRLLVNYIGVIEERKYDDLFQFIVCEIVGQMLSNQVRHTLVDRLFAICHNSVTPKTILGIGNDGLKGIGLSQAKCRYILGFAGSVYCGNIDLDNLNSLDDEEVMKVLTSQIGIGNWTAKMVLLFALGRSNIVPYEDVAFQQGYRWLYSTDLVDKCSVLERAKKWAPYSSIAARYIYECVNRGLIKQSTDILCNK